MNHKYFPTKDLYDTWVKENPSVEILDFTEILNSGVYIEYIQMIASKRKKSRRTRKWVTNTYK